MFIPILGESLILELLNAYLLVTNLSKDIQMLPPSNKTILVPCDVTFDENTQYFQPYLLGESSCIEDKDNPILTENLIF